MNFVTNPHLAKKKLANEMKRRQMQQKSDTMLKKAVAPIVDSHDQKYLSKITPFCYKTITQKIEAKTKVNNVTWDASKEHYWYSKLFNSNTMVSQDFEQHIYKESKINNEALYEKKAKLKEIIEKNPNDKRVKKEYETQLGKIELETAKV